MKIFMSILMASLFLVACQPAAPQNDAMDMKDADGTSMVTDLPDQKEEGVFSVSGVNFKFLINDEENPDIKVKKGDKVTIQFASEQGFHDFVIEGYDVATKQLSAGGSTEVTFTADKTGSFKYFCSVGNHRAKGMEGNFVVEEADAIMDMKKDEMDHMGCQEGEVDSDGNCTVAMEGEKNADLFSQLDAVKVDGKDINYYDDFNGYLATPQAKGDYPGIVMIHEWWGLNENVKQMADLLANEGYNVLAVDLYGEFATTSDRAGELAGSVRSNPEPAIENMQAAVDYLKNKTGSNRIASMGWCFGGQQSLNLSLTQKDLDATVIYYGQLTGDKDQLKQLSGPVLGIFGEEDGSITVESVNAFEKALSDVNIDHEIHIYPGVGHAFANPSGSRYAAEETLDAWEKTLSFLGNSLK